MKTHAIMSWEGNLGSGTVKLTNTKHEEREKTQKLFRICKNTESSYFEDMKYEDIQNDYQAYWHIIKD